MDLNSLYQKKGQITTTIEVAQAQLAEVNKRIIEVLNTQNAPKEEPVKKDKPKEKKDGG